MSLSAEEVAAIGSVLPEAARLLDAEPTLILWTMEYRTTSHLWLKFRTKDGRSVEWENGRFSSVETSPEDAEHWEQSMSMLAPYYSPVNGASTPNGTP
jgi:hypothetical protein